MGVKCLSWSTSEDVGRTAVSGTLPGSLVTPTGSFSVCKCHSSGPTQPPQHPSPQGNIDADRHGRASIHLKGGDGTPANEVKRHRGYFRRTRYYVSRCAEPRTWGGYERLRIQMTSSNQRGVSAADKSGTDIRQRQKRWNLIFRFQYGVTSSVLPLQR